tara:strand:+ start:4547 stop:5065 length:519 start_codon:yes stop_codon:yes gene_type:complete
MATVYDIVKGINQAAANAYDGSDAKVGLNREQGDLILDRRVIDGFKVRIMGPILRVSYQSEARLRDVKEKDFEDSILSKLADIVKFLKKEYKSITGDTLTLTKEGEHQILVQRMSNYRTDIQAQCDYKIGGMKDCDEVDPGTPEENLDKSIRAWLELGPGKKRPSNDTRKGS